MPTTLTPSGAYGAGTVTAPVAGEARSSLSVRTMAQQLLNMVGFLKDLTDAGVIKARSVANVAALKAVTGQATGEHRVVKDLGLFEFDAASSATSDDVTVVTPTVGGGRWLSSYRSARVANGFAPLDAGALVPAANLRGSLLSQGTATVPAVGVTTVSVANTFLGAAFGSTSLVIGQTIEFEVALNAKRTTGLNADGNAIAIVIYVLDGGGSIIGELGGTRRSVGHFNVNSFDHYGMRGTFQAAANGTHQLRLAGSPIGPAGTVDVQSTSAVGRLCVWKAP